jgi:hypothetical protein
MFTAPPTVALTSQPREGIGARVVGGISRFGAALRRVVAGDSRRPQSGPDSGTAPDADRPPAARQARAPRQPGRAGKGGLARLFGRRRALAAVPEQARELPDFEFTGEAFPELSPEARAFFNTPLEECDPAMLGVVLEALAEVIARSMTPQEGMRDARDVFLALRSRMEAVSGEAGDAPPDALPDVAAAPADLAATAAIDPAAIDSTAIYPAAIDPAAIDPAAIDPAAIDPTAIDPTAIDPTAIDPAAIDPAAIDPQAASPGLPGPAPRRDSPAPPSEETAAAQGAAAAASTAPDQPATAPAGSQPSGVSVSGISTKNAGAPNRGRVPPGHARRRLFRGGPGFSTRSLVLPRRNIPLRGRYVVRSLPQPARLLCYAACAGPPGLLRRA